MLAGVSAPAGLRSGILLVPRGEFSIAIAGIGVTAGVEPKLAPLAVACVLILANARPGAGAPRASSIGFPAAAE